MSYRIVREFAPSELYQEALRTQAELWALYELLDEDGEVVFSSAVEAGSSGYWVPTAISSVEFDISFTQPAEHSVTVPVADGVTMATADGHPFRDGSHRLAVSAGFRIGDEIRVHRMVTLEIVSGENISDAAGSRMDLKLRTGVSRLESSFSQTEVYEHGANALETAVAIAEPVYSGSEGSTVTSESAEWEIPRIDVEVGDNRLTLVERLLEATGFEISEDPFGNITFRRVPSLDIPEDAEARWSYGDHDGAIPVAQVREPWTLTSPISGVRVVGGTGDFDGPSGSALIAPDETAFDFDTTSRGYVTPGTDSVGRIVDVENELVLSSQQALEAGYSILRKTSQGARRVVLTIGPNPAMRAGDVVDFSSSGHKISLSKWTVEQISVPMTPGAMTVSLVASWNPEGEVPTPGKDIKGDPLAEAFGVMDSFDRPDGDLNGEGTDWLEVGYSMNIRNNQAVQLFGGGWVAAWYKWPLLYHDANVRHTISALDNPGDKIGPMVRGDTNGSGFALLATGSQKLELWRFHNRVPVELLDSHDHGATLVGTVIRIRIFDTFIEGLIDEVQVVTATSGANQANRLFGIYAYAQVGGVNSPGITELWAGEAIAV